MAPQAHSSVQYCIKLLGWFYNLDVSCLLQVIRCTERSFVIRWVVAMQHMTVH